MKDHFVIGIDFGTDSVRSVIVNAATGEENASAIFSFPRWNDRLYCNAMENRFRQHPLDYLEGMENTIQKCLNLAGRSVISCIRSISIDTTGSTPVAVNQAGAPLALLPGFEENPNAMFVLWKDHTAVKEAAEINAHAKKFDTDYLKYAGGIYSSEWFWAKLLHVLREDEAVGAACYSWIEHCDWIPFLLTGGNRISEMKRSRCAAGHKALWAEDYGGLPPDNFFTSLDPLLKGFPQRLYTDTYTADMPAGYLSKEWAQRLGLTTDVVVGVGAFDAHMGAVGGQIEPYHLSKVMGTSTCDMLVTPLEQMKDKLVKGICGQVPGSIIPGMIGMEAGQSAFGDIYAWYRNLITWPLQRLLRQSESLDKNKADALIQEITEKTIPALSEEASRITVTPGTELATDWLNGRRTPDANQELKATVSGLSLASDAPSVFRALVEASCFGARKIVERFTEEGIPIKGLIGLGGVAKKSPFIMQTMADVINMPIRIHRSEQTCALGAAMFAATAAGIYNRVEDAMAAMGGGFETTYLPDDRRTFIYHQRYRQYLALGDFMELQPAK